MWVSSQFENKREIERQGICNKLVVDRNRNIDILLDKELKQVVIGNKSRGYVLADEIGISGNLNCLLFFVNNGMVLEIEKGCVYLKSKHGSVFNIDCNGEIEIAEVGTEVKWKTEAELKELISNIIRGKFYLDKHREKINKYVDNLVYALEMDYKADISKEFRLRLTDCFKTLSLNEFEFIDYKEEKKKEQNKVIKEAEEVEGTEDEEDVEYIIFNE